jgi:hypothetical protein
MDHDQITNRLSILLDVLAFVEEHKSLPSDLGDVVALATLLRIVDILNHLA